ncbi:MAG: hypothetical protein ACREXW_07925 [Gammaproteobacteria bacterium]
MMQKTSFYFVPSRTLVFAVICGTSLAGELPEGHAAPSLPAVTSNPLRVAEASTVLSEFEGRYRVGNTTCTVNPIKMAFEVRWAKGRGAMRFFFDSTTAEGKPIFVSEDSGKGTDRFIFDDNRFNSGQFIRADGRALVVERVK